MSVLRTWISTMGTRLYPNTKDTATLEKLAGVQSGTMRQLDLWKEMKATYLSANDISDDDDIGFDMWCIVHGSEVERLYNFLLNGWGKFDLSLIPLDENGSDNSRVSGEAKVGGLAFQLLMSASRIRSEVVDDPFLSDAELSVKVVEILSMAEGVHWG